MGVYIKNGKKPDYCINPNTGNVCFYILRCKECINPTTNAPYIGKRPEGCPLVDVTVPHGRLADLDAALECVDDDSIKDCDAKWEAIRLFDWAMSKRVVIEAED